MLVSMQVSYSSLPHPSFSLLCSPLFPPSSLIVPPLSRIYLHLSSSAHLKVLGETEALGKYPQF